MTKNLLVNSIVSNMDIMKHLLNQPHVLDRELKAKGWNNQEYYTINPDNIELRIRIKLLRKELKKLEKEIMSESRKWGIVKDEA